MIKFNEFIKVSENISNDPQVGQYVVCVEENTNDGNDAQKDVKIFVKNSIGKIVKIFLDKDNTYPYIIQFENIPEDINRYFGVVSGMDDDCRTYSREEIKAFSNYKEDLEHIILANKYNI